MAMEDKFLEAIARGWTTPENENKVMDSDLAKAICREVYKVYLEGVKEEIKTIIKDVKKADVDGISHYGSAGAGIMYTSMLEYLEEKLAK